MTDSVNRKNPPISVILVAFNAGGVIARTIAAIQQHFPGAEIVVVDNGSTDDSIDIARRAAPGLTLVQGHGNVGFGGGVNRGARAASGDLLLVLNTDAPPTSANEAKLQELAGRAHLGLVTCSVSENGETTFPVFRQHGWRWELMWLIGQAFLKPKELRITRRVVPASTNGAWLAGVALLARRDEFLGVGGFDERFFLYSEDRDLSHTYRTAGLPLLTTDAIAVEHRYTEYLPSTPAEQIAWSLLSLLEYVGKWRGTVAAQNAATLTLRALDATAALGVSFGWLPELGKRARSRIDMARAVRQHILSVASGEKGPAVSYDIVRNLRFPA